MKECLECRVKVNASYRWSCTSICIDSKYFSVARRVRLNIIAKFYSVLSIEYLSS